MTTEKLTPKMQDALTKIKAAGKVGEWLNAYAAIGVNGHSVRALRHRGLLVRDGKYLVPAGMQSDIIGNYRVWPDGSSEAI
ncbi:hypothetical protein [Streptomyces sp. NRRL S-31]|uniref:hypothetical protein n=1 Tax=Streptomyces sp. NRRL S-31 TaxID=1463898 RepID=UPI00131B51ED|nr:hypothetical protein [Streptomyces sp. NRRL S-31]